jgi:hypothetical protein
MTDRRKANAKGSRATLMSCISMASLISVTISSWVRTLLANSGATTGRFRIGSRSRLEIRLVVPLTWRVYWDSPMTVALILSAGSATGTSSSHILFRISSPRMMPRSPKLSDS